MDWSPWEPGQSRSPKWRLAPVQLVALGDPVLGPIPDPVHAFIEFPTEPRKVIETKAKLLLAAARQRGRLHPLDGSVE